MSWFLPSRRAFLAVVSNASLIPGIPEAEKGDGVYIAG
jgi:hypothetical protein